MPEGHELPEMSVSSAATGQQLSTECEQFSRGVMLDDMVVKLDF